MDSVLRVCAADDCAETFEPSKHGPFKRFCSNRCRGRITARRLHLSPAQRERKAAWARAYRAIPANRERINKNKREGMRERCASDPEYHQRLNNYKANWYQNLSGFEYNRTLLRGRRRQALVRMAKRHLAGEEASG